MKNLRKNLIILSSILLLCFSLIVSYCGYKSISLGILASVIIIIPSIYSLIPLIEQLSLKRNENKNRLTDLTFTDRHEDIQSIMKKLTIQEHILEIKGDFEQCGKSWLAKRLCDYINFPNEIENKKICNIRSPYNKAIYVDMHEKTEDFLNDFFEKHIINQKVVLIFDHVENLNIILTKQSLYHFQLVYILKESYGQNVYFSHSVSEFKKEYIDELQNKIKQNYPGINNITKKEINVLYNLTNGNIAKIYALLSRQEYINWIKNIANNRQTEYDFELNQIKADLYIGKYENAKQKLEYFKSKYEEGLTKNNDLLFKYYMLESDCEHLLNNYDAAVDILSALEIPQYTSNNVNFEIELHKAHYYKHLWECNISLEILKNLGHLSYTAMVDSLGILAAKYFIDDLYVPNSEHDTLEEFKNTYISAENSTLPQQDNDILKLKRNTPVYIYYSEYPKEIEKLLKKINEVIRIYEAQNNRLLANAYFIRGEIYRLYKKYNNAVQDYSKCLTITYDNNIIIQVNLMVYYLRYCKKIKINFDLLSKNEIINLCKNKNKYGEKLLHRINSIELGDPNAEKIRTCFDTRIMPIL